MLQNKILRNIDFESLRIDVSDKCNNNCIFCSDSERQELTTNEVEEVLEKNKYLKKVTFSCGEPTLNKNLASWIKTAKENDYKIINLITNGRMLSYSKYAKSILSSGVNELTISIHSHDKNTHNALTRSKSFDQTKKAIEKISIIKKQYPIKFKINVTITKINHDFKGIYHFLSKYNIDVINLNVVKPQGNALRNSKTLLPKYTEVVNKFNIFLEKDYDNKIHICLSGIPSCINKNGSEYEKMQIYYGGKYYDNEEFEHKIKIDFCKKCSKNKNCSGIWKEYVKIYGVGEFKPLIIKKKKLWEDPTYLTQIRAVKEGIKPCARIEVVKVKDIPKISSLIKKFGLRYILSDEQFTLDSKNMLFSKAKHNHEDNYISVFVSVDKKLSKELKSETKKEQKIGKISTLAKLKTGKLLGYPKCCVQKFANKGEYRDDKASNVDIKRETAGKLNWKLNNLINPYRLIEFFPCSYNCKKAASYAEKMLGLVSAGRKKVQSKIKKYLRSIVLYQDFNNYIVLDGKINGNEITYNYLASSVDFAADFMQPGHKEMDSLSDMLKNGDKISFDDGSELKRAEIYNRNKLIGILNLENKWCLFDFKEKTDTSLERFEKFQTTKEVDALCNHIGSKYKLGKYFGFYKYKYHSCDNVSLIKYKRKKIIVKFINDLDEIEWSSKISSLFSDGISIPKPFSSGDKLDYYKFKGKRAIMYDYIPHLKRIDRTDQKTKKSLLPSVLKLLKESAGATEIIKEKYPNRFQKDYLRANKLLTWLDIKLEKYLSRKSSKIEPEIEKIILFYKKNRVILKKINQNVENYTYFAKADIMCNPFDSKIYLIDAHFELDIFYLYIANIAVKIAQIYGSKYIFKITEYLADEFKIKKLLREIYLLEISMLISGIINPNDKGAKTLHLKFCHKIVGHMEKNKIQKSQKNNQNE